MIEDILHKTVECVSGIREGRTGVVLEISDRVWKSNGLHVLVSYPNGAKHWHHVSTVKVVRVNPG